ncbi:hypothetical protein MGG_16842 [Pyricularia oryzae 70-15]|uniref:Uncharacterized protein n=1 Tax=Pyricularia oryzae (strain 70-15 / ATCC MYA-4617 / FGSC 8958) TaxID=242507 RepID=G4N3V3_PYRO7|nr:uncharacterized protein MGG_16842 [Pyricularia oryzae 70-15]EHA52726.1 hypothetical protein MGG_16842 [Pyricularia oryzae 70-15]
MKPEAMRIINAFGLKPIHIATIRGQKGNVSMLVNAGTNVNEQTRHGITPLMLGALFGHIDIVALLIKNGAERSIQDAEQRTAKEFKPSQDTLERFRKDIQEASRTLLFSGGGALPEKNPENITTVRYFQRVPGRCFAATRDVMLLCVPKRRSDIVEKGCFGPQWIWPTGYNASNHCAGGQESHTPMGVLGLDHRQHRSPYCQ